MVWRHWVWLTFRAAHQNHQQELNSSYYTVSTGACWEQDGQNVAGEHKLHIMPVLRDVSHHIEEDML